MQASVGPKPTSVQSIHCMKPIDEIHLQSIDLNLLVALDALLTESSVTSAARRLGVSQSAMSHSLARLRRLLRDDVLVRSSRGMILTPRAHTLATPIRSILEDIKRTVASAPSFDPKTARRT